MLAAKSLHHPLGSAPAKNPEGDDDEDQSEL
jgi:hypothetical protein